MGYRSALLGVPLSVHRRSESLSLPTIRIWRRSPRTRGVVSPNNPDPQCPMQNMTQRYPLPSGAYNIDTTLSPYPTLTPRCISNTPPSSPSPPHPLRLLYITIYSAHHLVSPRSRPRWSRFPQPRTLQGANRGISGSSTRLSSLESRDSWGIGGSCSASIQTKGTRRGVGHGAYSGGGTKRRGCTVGSTRIPVWRVCRKSSFVRRKMWCVGVMYLCT